MAWQEPKTDWVQNPKNPKSEDFNRIEGNIEFLKQDIETKKGEIVVALNSVGISASINDTHEQIANKVVAAEKSGIQITPGTSNIAIPKGIYGVDGGIVLGDSDLVSSNIRSGANIFGVAGDSSVIDTSGGDAVASNILKDKKAYVKGQLVTGNIPTKNSATYTPGITNQKILAGQYLVGDQTITGDVNLVASNIVKGKSIFGVAGTVEDAKNMLLWQPNKGLSIKWQQGIYNNKATPTYTITDSFLRVMTTTSVGAYFVTVNPIDLTNISRIVFRLSSNKSYSGWGVVGLDPIKRTGATSASLNYNLAPFPIKYNVPSGDVSYTYNILYVEDLTGEHFLHVGAGVSDISFTIEEVYLISKL